MDSHGIPHLEHAAYLGPLGGAELLGGGKKVVLGQGQQWVEGTTRKILVIS